MSGNTQKGISNWFRKFTPCFTGDGKEEDVAASSSGILNLAVPNQDNIRLWASLDLARHGTNTYSWATVKSSPNRPSSSSKIRIDLLPQEGIFVGLYDSHGSNDSCAMYALGRLHMNLYDIQVSANPTIEDSLRQAFVTTDENWLKVVARDFSHNRLIAAAGTSSLVGIIGGGEVYFASVGDSTALIGEYEHSNIPIPDVLTREDNVNNETVRAEYRLEHPEPDILTQDSNLIYHIKGRTQLSKSLGDAYLKRTEFNLDDIPDYQMNSPISNPVLSAIPSTGMRVLQENHQFIIFGSKELWSILTASEVISIVQTSPPTGIAATVIRFALERVASRNSLTYFELQNVGEEHLYYNDIAVAIVLFDDMGTLTEEAQQGMGTITEEAQQGAITDIGSDSAGTDYYTALEEMDDDLDP